LSVLTDERKRQLAITPTDRLMADFAEEARGTRGLEYLRELRSRVRAELRRAGDRSEFKPENALEVALAAEQERQHHREMIRQLMQMQRTEAKRQEYIGMIRECLQPLEPTPLLPLGDDVARDPATHKPIHSWVLDLSDWHLGQRTPIQSCLTPETRVLTADLCWVPVGDLRVGDEVVGFDEYPVKVGGKRKLRKARITATGRRNMPIYFVRLATGEVLRATGEHKWLVKASGTLRWIRTDQLAEHLVYRTRRNPLSLPRFIRPWEPDVDSPEYLAGAFDGEGSLMTKRGVFTGVGFTQAENEMLVRVYGELKSSDRFTRTVVHRPGKQPIIQLRQSGWREGMRFLGQIRPGRLLARFAEKAWPSLDALEFVDIVEVGPDGTDEIVALSSSTETYIAEGFGSHNTGGVYEQTTEIVRWQVQQLISAARSIFDVEVKGQTIDEILVIFNGDLHENDSMRPGQAAKIDRLVTQQVVEVFDLASYVLRELLTFPGIKRIEVHNVGGNHDRTSPKRGDAGLGELDYVDTYAWLIGELLSRHFESEPRLTFKNWATYYGYTEFAGRKIIFEHGSSFKGGAGSYGGIPWYPIVNSARMLTDMLGGGDLVLFGHVHQPAILPIRQDSWVVINGALPATSSFLQSTYKALRTPTQWLLDLHEEHGVTDFRPLYARPVSLEKPGAIWKRG
jgi:hypothetical protein